MPGNIDEFELYCLGKPREVFVAPGIEFHSHHQGHLGYVSRKHRDAMDDLVRQSLALISARFDGSENFITLRPDLPSP